MPDSTGRAKLLVAGFHPLILADSRLQVEHAYDIDARSAEEDILLPAVDRVRPDVVLLDLLQTGSLSTIQRVARICPSCRIVALTGMRRAEVTKAILAAGASGVLYRAEAAAQLFVAVRTVLSGHSYVSPAFLRAPTGSGSGQLIRSHRLSSSDELVLRLIARDYPARRIARSLGLSLGAVRLSIAYLKQLFGRRTKRDLKHYAVTHNLVSECL